MDSKPKSVLDILEELKSSIIEKENNIDTLTATIIEQKKVIDEAKKEYADLKKKC